MNARALIALATLPLPLLAQNAPAPLPPDPAAAWKAFVRAATAYARDDSVVGWSALYLRNGRVVAHQEAGFADREVGQRVDTNTLFHWASTTKTMTAVAIMQLRDRGLLSLDDPVTRWIPELRRVHNPFGSMDAITIRMVLSHSSGFQNPTWRYRRGEPWEPFEPTDWEQLVAMMPYQQLVFAPGSRFGYSNPGFIYLGRIIELITGDPYQVYIQKNLWTPLGMTRSYFNRTPYFLESFRSNSYTRIRDTVMGRPRDTLITNSREFHTGITTANSGWNAPLADAARWASFLIGAAPGDTAGSRRYEQVLKRSTLEEMWNPVVAVSSDSSATTSFGLSFFITVERGRRVVYHTGDQQGFHLLTAMSPETRTGAIVAFNTSADSGAPSPLYAPMVQAATAGLLAPYKP
jgi:CubicO group peptidase (beta-lactamase class C family)